MLSCCSNADNSTKATAISRAAKTTSKRTLYVNLLNTELEWLIPIDFDITNIWKRQSDKAEFNWSQQMDQIYLENKTKYKTEWILRFLLMLKIKNKRKVQNGLLP